MGLRLDREVSKRYADLIGAQPQECYSNSIRALVVVVDQIKDVKYCEGYASTDRLQGIPIQHGWLEATIDGETRVIDVTWYNRKDEKFIYNPIVKLTNEEVWSLFKRRSKLKTPLMDYYNRELVERGLLTTMNQQQFMEMLNKMHEEFNDL